MSSKTQALLARLDAIGLSLQRSGNALALLGLGSVVQSDSIWGIPESQRKAPTWPGRNSSQECEISV